MFTALQTEAKAALDAAVFFSAAPAIPVYYEQLHDIVSQIEISIGKIGACVVILTPAAPATAHGPYPCFSRVQVVARVFEDVIINRGASGSQQPASLIAEAVAFHLTGRAVTGCGGNKLLLEGINLVDDPQYQVYDVTLFTGAVISAAPARV